MNAAPFRLAAGAEPMPGYRLEAFLGKGGFGEVWRAVAPGGFRVALKFLAADEAGAARELRSLEMLQHVRDAHLLSLFSVSLVPGWYVLAMELADGALMDRLNQCLKQGLPGVPRDELLRYFGQAADAIDFLNEPRHVLVAGGQPTSIQHGDIKPQNLMLVGRGCKVGDFGLLRRLGGSIASQQTTSLTAAYAPPEVFDGRPALTSDQYSLAVTWCQLRGGRLPFEGGPIQLMAAHMRREPDLRMLPEAERGAVARALSKQPPERWPTCSAFVEELRVVPSGPAPLPAPRPTVAIPTAAPGSFDRPTSPAAPSPLPTAKAAAPPLPTAKPAAPPLSTAKAAVQRAPTTKQPAAPPPSTAKKAAASGRTRRIPSTPRAAVRPAAPRGFRGWPLVWAMAVALPLAAALFVGLFWMFRAPPSSRDKGEQARTEPERREGPPKVVPPSGDREGDKPRVNPKPKDDPALKDGPGSKDAPPPKDGPGPKEDPRPEDNPDAKGVGKPKGDSGWNEISKAVEWSRREAAPDAAREAAIAAGLRWLTLHQAADGHWSLHEFPKHARTKPLPGGVVQADGCTGAAKLQNDVAATAFGLLPFLAAGHTQRPSKDAAVDYSKTVQAGLNYLRSKQDPKTGYFGTDMYGHGLAAIALCEAYGLTADPSLKPSAQKAIDYLEYAQDPVGGGWRYSPRTTGDLSVTGWQLTALKSAQMAGLSVKANTFTRAEGFLHSVEVAEVEDGKKVHGGGYTYVQNSGASPTMTAAGMLCSMHLGGATRNPDGLRKGVAFLLQEKDGAYPYLPNKTKNLYYEYYATQVMHHVGGENWRLWNEGPDGKSGIRDTLIAKMDAGDKIAAQRGSWAPQEGDGHTSSAGRIMATSLSLLCLEVQDRHLPLFRRTDGPAEISREISLAKGGKPDPVALKREPRTP